MSDDPHQEKIFGPLISEEPSTLPDPTYILKGTYVTLEYLREDHMPSLWTNYDFLGAGSSIEDFLPGSRCPSMEDLKKDLLSLMTEGITGYAVKADLNCLGPGNGKTPGEKNEVLGVIFYEPKPAMREIEIGMIHAKALHRTYAATEAHFLALRNVCEADSPGLVGGKSLPYRKVGWRCNSLNLKSKGCAERMGYRWEGRLRKNQIAKGRSRDTDLYGFVDEEWPAIYGALEVWLGEANFDGEGRQRRRLQDIRKELEK